MKIILAKKRKNDKGAPYYRLSVVGGTDDPFSFAYDYQNGLKGVIKDAFSLNDPHEIEIQDIPGRDEKCVIIRGEE
jgi:hypothetical protein